jgi:hypothetical protein
MSLPNVKITNPRVVIKCIPKVNLYRDKNASKSETEMPINRNPVFKPVLFIRYINGVHIITDNNKT